MLINFREKIVLDNLELALNKLNILTDWEQLFISDIYRKIQNKILKPENLSHKQFNTLHKIIEGFK